MILRHRGRTLYDSQLLVQFVTALSRIDMRLTYDSVLVAASYGSIVARWMWIIVQKVCNNGVKSSRRTIRAIFVEYMYLDLRGNVHVYNLPINILGIEIFIFVICIHVYYMFIICRCRVCVISTIYIFLYNEDTSGIEIFM